MVVLLFGPPGCGKGTQSPWITRLLDVPAISTGEMLRAEAKLDTPLGREVGEILARGHLVDDETVNQALLHRLSEADCQAGFLLDGYPRTVSQATFLDGWLRAHNRPAPLVLHLATPFPVLVDRISSRRQCPDCLRVYNLLYRRPMRSGLCDQHDVELVCRRDDQQEVVTARLDAYERQTAPVLSYYANGRGTYHELDGNRAPEAISQEIQSLLEDLLVRVRRRGTTYR